MGHHQLPPQIDFAIRSFIRRHKRAIKLCFLVSIPLFLLLLIGTLWALVWGAGYLKDYVSCMSMPRFPAQFEQKLGDVAFAQLKAQTRFLNDPTVLKPLNSLAAPLIASTQDKSRQFTLFVSDAKEINACALPGGYIVFNRGLLERAKSAEEIQGVLAHEMAHIVKRHSLFQLAQNLGVKLAVDALSDSENPIQDALLRNASTLLSVKFSRNHEREADDLGWELLQNAQINPQGMVDFFVSLQAEAGATPGPTTAGSALLSTHPTPQERIDRLQQKKASLAGRKFTSSDVQFQAIQEALRTPMSNALRIK